LDRISPPGARFSAKSELYCGLPYQLHHADVLAEHLALLVESRAPKKGLITDLDETLWRGIAGEVGAQNVSWDLDHHSQMHGVYQQALRSLAEASVLIAAASKNDSHMVSEVFQREDLLLPEKHVFPIEAHWGAKSTSAARILKTWNMGADSVVFIDDNPMELAEVRSAFPEVECIQFPTGDDQAIYELLGTLRDIFGRQRVSEEDQIRIESIRGSQQAREELDKAGAASTQFMKWIEGQIKFDWTKTPLDPRALGLVNKTNQFNLNGTRYTESEWLNYLQQAETFLLLVSYQDRYGRLGKIAAIRGRATDEAVFVDNWVMSCRAFARQIEHHCLDHLFDRCGKEVLVFNFVTTPRNAPLQNFFKELLGEVPKEPFRLHRCTFVDRCPELPHRVARSEDASLPVASNNTDRSTPFA
jgi:FkbH-like protein